MKSLILTFLFSISLHAELLPSGTMLPLTWPHVQLAGLFIQRPIKEL